MEENNNIQKESLLKLELAKLKAELQTMRGENKKQQTLLDELYELVYYKRAWLTLSDDNIEGMKKIVDRIPPEDRCATPPRTSKEPLECDDTTWGV